MDKVKLNVINDIQILAWSNFVMECIMMHFRGELLGNNKDRLQQVLDDKLKQYHCEFSGDFLLFESKEDMIHFLLTWS